MVRRLALGLIGLVVAALVVTGIVLVADHSSSHPPSRPSSRPSAHQSRPTQQPEPSASSLASFYRQHLQWSRCHRGDLCSRLTVPLDYRHPHGATIRLAVLKLPARKPSERLGVLVTDPGGPGVGGTQSAQTAQDWARRSLLDHYDVVGFDPRATGHSDPIRCLSTKQLDQYLAVTNSVPTTAAQRAATAGWIKRIGAGCLAESPALAPHISTVDTAYDMDILRAALGERKLTYLGYSYGTYLGTVYADLFPHHVGRFVLDGAVDPRLQTLRDALGQAAGFETDLDDYIHHCVAGGHCFLGSSFSAGEHRITGLLAKLRTHSLPAGRGRRLTQGNAYLGISETMYARYLWPYLTQALRQAFAGHGGDLMRASDWYTERGAHGYLDNEMEAFYAITCADNPWSVPMDKVPSYVPQFEKVAPVFGAEFAWNSLPVCSGWKAPSDLPTPPVGAPGAGPILVLGTTRDPATPLKWARLLANSLSSGELLIRRGDGHTAYGTGNACIDGAVDEFLITGREPKPGTVC